MDKDYSSYKTIGEVSKILSSISKQKKSVPAHTIRFWEKKFKQIKPKILNGNRRYYDIKNVDLLKKILFLLKDKKKLKLSRFGTFSIRQKKSRVGRNPKTKESKVISSRDVVLFKPSKEFKELVNLLKNE